MIFLEKILKKKENFFLLRDNFLIFRISIVSGKEQKNIFYVTNALES
jgi:hypothetical protein